MFDRLWPVSLGQKAGADFLSQSSRAYLHKYKIQTIGIPLDTFVFESPTLNRQMTSSTHCSQLNNGFIDVRRFVLTENENGVKLK